MSNEPIFQKLAREYAASGKSYERMTTPYLSPVRPLGVAKQPLMDTPVYGPNEHLDGPYKAPLPKRNLAQLIQIPEPDPEVTKRFQNFISTAPLQILQGTPAGSFRGVTPVLEIADEVQRFQETGELDPITIDPEAVNPPQTPISYIDVLEAAEKIGPAVVLTKTITTQELIDGRTSADIIQELGQEFAEKYPKAAVMEVNVGEKLNGDMIVTVRGTLISEEDGTSNPTTTKQTDESVNAASNEENDEDDEPVILAPNFWKIRDEE